MKKLKTILVIIFLLISDLFGFAFFGLLLMGYEDNYDESKGEMWSLASMNTLEKIFYLCYNGWILLNILVLCYIVFLLYKWTRNKIKSVRIGKN